MSTPDSWGVTKGDAELMQQKEATTQEQLQVLFDKAQKSHWVPRVAPEEATPEFRFPEGQNAKGVFFYFWPFRFHSMEEEAHPATRSACWGFHNLDPYEVTDHEKLWMNECTHVATLQS